MMFEALFCAIHNKPAKLGKAHLVITQTANPYNKEECMCSQGRVCTMCKAVCSINKSSSFRIETPSGHGWQLVSGCAYC